MSSEFLVVPMNYKSNREKLSNTLYRLEGDGDIALVLFEMSFDPDTGLTSKMADEKSLKDMNADIDKIWKDAFKNSLVIAPPRIHMDAYSLEKPDPTRGAFMDPACELKIKFNDIPVVTTANFDNGAAAVFYPGVKEKLAEMAGKSYYVTFTSVREARIHVQGSMEPSKIQEMLLNSNALTDKASVLSGKVYFYNAETGDFTSAEYNTGN